MHRGNGSGLQKQTQGLKTIGNLTTRTWEACFVIFSCCASKRMEGSLFPLLVRSEASPSAPKGLLLDSVSGSVASELRAP